MPLDTRILPKKYDYLQEIKHNPYCVFAMDFTFFVIHMYGLVWIPVKYTSSNKIQIPLPGRRVYSPHPLSTFSDVIREAIGIVIRRSTLDYESLYEKLVPAGAENKLEIFIDHVNEVFDKLSKTPSLTFAEVLVKYLYVVRITVLFYKYGTKEAPHIVHALIASSLVKVSIALTPSECFYEMNIAAEHIIDWFENKYDGQGFEENYSEDENMDEQLDQPKKLQEELNETEHQEKLEQSEEQETLQEKPDEQTEKQETLQEKPDEQTEKQETLQEKPDEKTENYETLQEKPDEKTENYETLQEKPDEQTEKHETLEEKPDEETEKRETLQEKHHEHTEKHETLQEKLEQTEKQTLYDKLEQTEKHETLQVLLDDHTEKHETFQEELDTCTDKHEMFQVRFDKPVEKHEALEGLEQGEQHEMLKKS